MKMLSAKSRISIGLVCLLLSVLCTAMMLGMAPDQRSAILAGRADVCETIAMTSSDYIGRGELRRLEFFIQSVVERNDGILSAGVRRTSGQLVTSVGNHEAMWQAEISQRSTDTQVHVPIRSGEEKWGSVELRFQPLTTPGIAGWLGSSWVQLTMFVTAASYLLFFVYLGKMLQHLDPSKAVPGRVRSALDSLAEGLLVLDKDQRIVLANQSFAAWLGRDPEKMIGVHAAKLDWVKNEQGEPLDEYPWVEAIRLEAPQAGIMLGLTHKNEPTRILMANASPVLGHDGKYRGVLVSFDDVTQLEDTRKDLKVAKKFAEDANHAKSEFLARMSHEIRTPMNAILGYTDVLRRGFDESVENRQEYLDTIHGSGEHLLALINDILDLSKVESGQMELELERCSPHKLIAQVVMLLRSKAEEKRIALDFRCDGLIPETILTDSVRLRQTIMNLAGNAIKFTEAGSVTVAARFIEQEPSQTGGNDGRPANGQLAIDVIDTGIGIKAAAQEKIFEPFSQADTSVTRRFGGTGLGLAISKQLAEAMGGGIDLTSQEGEGSTFTVSIDTGPLDGIKLVDGKTAIASDWKEAAEDNEVLQLPPARILVADDGESNRKLLDLVLRRAGVEVVSVENGKLAVDEALASSFDVILMDMQMPVMDGYTAATTLREAGYEKPIIALTAHAMRGDEEKCREAGCSGFMTKPIKIDVLLATLSNLLGEGGDTAAPTSAPTDARSASDVVAEPALPTQDECQQAEETLTELAEMSRDLSRPSAPIQCSLPLDDPDFLEIAEEFVVRLDEQLLAMREACSTDDTAELAGLAHWLKGSGGTAGFDVFTKPSYELELAAKSQQRDQCELLIGKLAELAARIELPGSDRRPPAPCDASDLGNAAEDKAAEGDALSQSNNDPPLLSSLPMDDDDFREIVEEFVDRLAEKLESMEQAWEVRDYCELANLAHWLKGSGGTAGFDSFTLPAKVLEHVVKSHNDEIIPAAIDDLRQIAARIVIRPTVETGM